MPNSKFIRFFISVLSLCVFAIGRAQEPSYIRIGESELSGIDVYSIVQDSMDNIWMSTNNSLVKYDGYEFKFIDNSNLKNRSLFGLTKDRNGRMFCFNLGGEILYVDNDSLKHYYQIPDSLLIDNFTIAFNGKNQMVVGAKHPFLLKENGNITFLKKPENLKINWLSMISTESGDIFLSTPGQSTLFRIQGDSIVQDAIRVPMHGPNLLYSYRGEKYLGESNSFNLFRIRENTLSRLPLQLKNAEYFSAHNLYITNKEKYWYSLRKEGMVAFDKFGRALFGGVRILKNFYISGVLEDSEGNLWFTTLGEGVLYFKNPELLSFSEHELLKNERLLRVEFDRNGSLYVGTKSGKIFCIKENKPTLIHKNENIGIELLQVNNNELITAGINKIFFIDIEKQENSTKVSHRVSTIKDIHRFSDSKYLISSRTGVSLYNGRDFQTLYNGRSYCSYYDKRSNSYLISTAKGFYALKKGEDIKGLNEFLDNGNRLSVNGFAGNEQRIWVATSSRGILEFKNDSLHTFLNMQNGLLSNRINKIKYYNNQLIIAHAKGVQILDLRTSEIKTINELDGIYASNVQDVAIFENQLAILTSGGLQLLNMDYELANNHAPKIEFHRILINDSIVTNGSNQFKHNQNKVTFEFRSKAYAHRGNLIYRYRLIGLSNEWQQAGYKENIVKFNSLEPGEYVFEVKAVNEKGVEGIPVNYAFIIQRPVWNRWWFIGMVMIVFVVVVLLVYRYQIARIRKKNRQKNELISSKLTAIQSQMNPHFIFNALNSIQDLVLKHDIDNSYDYIVKFSNLLRRTLKYSDKDFIDFDSEIKLIELYLQLEKLRFKKNFEYEVITNGIEDVLVPPMIIQPFLENAIKHGLLHKSDGIKLLKIEFSRLQEILECTITDNGVGREKAREIKQRQNQKHESFSVKAISERFRILQEQFGSGIGMEYEDLFEGKKPAGTKVVLRLPFKQKF